MDLVEASKIPRNTGGAVPSCEAERPNCELLRFSTNGLPPSERLAVWREVLGRVHMRLDLEALGEGDVHTSIEQHSWSYVSIYFSESSAVSASRTPELLQDGNDDFRLVRAEGAPFEYVSGGVTHEMNGCSALVFAGSAGTLRYLGTNRVTSLRVPRVRLAAAVRNFEELPMRRIAPASPQLRLLNGYTELLRREGPTADPVLAYRSAQHLVDLLALAIGPTDETYQRASGGALREARLATIRADILANLSQTRLSAKTVARRHGITDRYVHLLFEEIGTTFGRFVQEERLKRAYVMLTDPGYASMRISDIAAKVGLAELSNFSRGFRQRFGDTPRAIRRGGRQRD
jgi:AraC-like DNA-binding protein